MAAPIQSSIIDRWTGSIHKSLASAKPKSDSTGKPWSTSLWGCFMPIDLCVITLCCPCATFGKTYHRMENEGNMTTYEAINTPCLLFCLSSCFGIHWVVQTVELSELRAKHSLEGNMAIDICKSCCCTCCALMQAEKESRKLLPVAGEGMDGIVEKEYKARAGAGADAMMYAPQAQEHGESQQ